MLEPTLNCLNIYLHGQYSCASDHAHQSVAHFVTNLSGQSPAPSPSLKNKKRSVGPQQPVCTVRPYTTDAQEYMHACMYI